MNRHHHKKPPHLFETKEQPVLTRTEFAWRMARSAGIATLIVLFSLALGGAGYHYTEELPWIDSFLNASMILTGMGPVDDMKSNGGKIFAIIYSLYSGIAFLTMMAVLLAPVLHRILHQFHVTEDDDKD